jgi:hypothetical protein
MKYSKFGGYDSEPSRILLKYIPLLIKRRERKDRGDITTLTDIVVTTSWNVA